MAEKSFEWFGLHKLIRRVVFEATLECVEPLRVGAGRGAAAFEPVDLVVVKVRDANGHEYPYIPGSSLKGAIRSHCVKLMRSAGLRVCDGLPGATCLRGNEFDELERAGLSHEDIIRAIASRSIDAGICLGCLIFGAPGLASHTRFYDAYPENYRLGYRTMVAIERRTGAARRGALFSVEYVEPGSRFSFRIEFLNLPNYAIGVVAEALRDMDLGLLKLGGLKTRGFGWVKIVDLRVTCWDFVQGRSVERIPPLDPIDSWVEIASSWTQTLGRFCSAWRTAIPKLRRVSDEGWRWSACLG